MTPREIDVAEERAPELAGFDVPNLDDMSTDPMDYAAMERTLYCRRTTSTRER
jgi:hypothetical protein